MTRYNVRAVSITFPLLTHLTLVPHICISDLVPAVVQIMACRLFGATPLSKQMLGYCQLEQTSVKF